jgi:hypothetical protein
MHHQIQKEHQRPVSAGLVEEADRHFVQAREFSQFDVIDAAFP